MHEHVRVVAALLIPALALGPSCARAPRQVRLALAKAPGDLPLQRLELRLQINRFMHKLRRLMGWLPGR